METIKFLDLSELELIMKVSLFCVGAAKAGTTSIFELLKNSKQLEIPLDKEPHYFGEYCVGPKKFETLNEYHSNYKDINSNRKALDFSTSYLYSETASKEIFEYNPDAKILIVVRNPIDRAVSLYNHQRRSMLESKDIEAAFSSEYERIKSGYDYGFHYATSGLYYEQIKRFYNTFPKEQILVLTFDELVKEQRSTLRKVLNFFDISDIDESETLLPQENKTGIPRNKFIQTLLVKDYPLKGILKKIVPASLVQSTRKNNVGSKQNASVSLKKYLADFFREDQRKLQEFLSNINDT